MLKTIMSGPIFKTAYKFNLFKNKIQYFTFILNFM